MSALTTGAGWRWVKQGFALFRKRPGQLTFLFTSYMFVMIALGLIPVVGQLLPLFLAPVFSMVFMTICAHIEQEKILTPQILRASFAPPVANRLFTLGVLYLLAALLAVGVSALIDGGLFMKLMMGQREAEAGPGQRASVLLTIALLAIAFIPVFWYAAPLVVWQKMSVGKAMFFSFFSVFRAFKTFLVYFLSWVAIGAIAPTLVAGILMAVAGKNFAMMLMFLLTILLTVIMYCSFYSTYVDVFGKPDLNHP
ncbi:MAG: hypothetical protein H6R01_839 [Burkholderiaceae bacterium]|nr:hypothetical protein [Burkholderiaceae bacterium]